MPFFIRVRSRDGTQTLSDTAFGSLAEAREDACIGAKQIVGDALKAGASLDAAMGDRTFDILDGDGSLIVSLPIHVLIAADED